MILPSPEDRGLVVFHVWPNLDYRRRLAVAFGLLFVGLVLQVLFAAIFPGVLLLAAGNLLLLVKGYDNRVELKTFDPRAEWERVEPERLDDLEALHRKMRRWDRSALDVTNPLGGILFLLLGVVLAGGIVLGIAFSRVAGPALRILAIDAAVLLLPHWVTGVRSILTRPKLMVRVALFRTLLTSFGRRLADHRVHVLMLLRHDDEKEQRMPDDVKIKIDVAGHHPDFLGLYGQVVINEVQGSSYPYFYVVLVARQGYGLADRARGYAPPANVDLETKEQDRVEVLVLRQHTTKTSGYHTDEATAATILHEGIRLAEQLAAEPAAAAGPA